MVNKTDNPLVSITILTFNSSKYILEALESVKEQTYKNIELIISDDCSKDNTVEVCKAWIEMNKGRFVNIELITSPTNTGIPANKNRSIYKCKGEWIKSLPGDDALEKDAIGAYVEFIKRGDGIKLVYAFSGKYGDNFFEREYLSSAPKRVPKRFVSEHITSQQQYQILLRINRINAPSVFVKRELIDAVGGYDERFRLYEDLPMWLKLTKAGYKFHFMPVVTVKHRFHSNATMSIISERLYNDTYLNNTDFREHYIYPNISRIERINLNYKLLIRKMIRRIGLDRNIYLIKITDRVLTRYLNPFLYVAILHRIKNKTL